MMSPRQMEVNKAHDELTELLEEPDISMGHLRAIRHAAKKLSDALILNHLFQYRGQYPHDSNPEETKHESTR